MGIVVQPQDPIRVEKDSSSNGERAVRLKHKNPKRVAKDSGSHDQRVWRISHKTQPTQQLLEEIAAQTVKG